MYGKTETVEFRLRAKPFSDVDIKIYGLEEEGVSLKAIATVSGYIDTFESNTIKYVIGKADGSNTKINMDIELHTGNIVIPGEIVPYFITVSHDNSENLKNAVIKCEIPKGVKFKSASNGGEYNEKTNTVTWNFESLAVETLVLEAEVEELESGEYKKDININLTATSDEVKEPSKSDDFTIKVRKQGYSISQISDVSSSNILSGNEITYAITVKNIGSKRAEFTITDILPNELEFIQYSYNRNGQNIVTTESTGNRVEITPSLDVGETLNIYVTARARWITGTRDITNRVILTSKEIENLEANEITHKLIGSENPNPGGDPNNPNNPNDPDNPNNPNDPNNPNNPNDPNDPNNPNNPNDPNDPNNPNNPNDPNATYIIQGTAWVDDNKDGKREDKDELLAKVKVYLLNSTNRKIIKETETNDNGVYIFDNVKRGSYLVAFEYDTGKYDITTYQAGIASDSQNSDVIKMNLKLNGDTRTYAVTNTILLEANTYNIDLGLVNDPKFDLELTKGIDLVQVSNGQGTTTYKLNHTDITKVEIPEKYMNGSVIAITYSFKVKNTGAISGYVNKIVDYKAKDLTFSATLNPEWYQDTDGSVYNTTLSGREIKPGETVELSLILTKTMTNENTGLSNNLAEITEASNDLGISDVDSVPGNRNTSEDDMGSADIVIAIKTGGPLFYGGIVLLVLAIFAFGAYEINKRVLRRI